MSSAAVSRARWAAVGAAIAVTLGAAGLGSYELVTAEISDGDRPVSVPITPCRVTDTRPDQGIGGRTTPLGAGETMTVDVQPATGPCAGLIATDAVIVDLNVTAVQATESTFLTLFTTGSGLPEASTLNPEPGERAFNGATIGVDANGRFDVYNAFGNVHVIIDITAYHEHHDHDDRYGSETFFVEPGPLGIDVVPEGPTLDHTSFTTTRSGRLEITVAVTTLVSCTTNIGPRAHFLLLDGTPLRSSVIFNNDSEWTSTHITATTESVVPAGEHEIEVGAECNGSNTVSTWSLRPFTGMTVVVLPE